VRRSQMNPAVDAEVLVRLLWRDEAFHALTGMGAQPDPRSHRASLWRELLDRCSVRQLRSVVRGALLRRDEALRRFPARGSVAAPGADASRL
jgi:hypothetical protein